MNADAPVSLTELLMYGSMTGECQAATASHCSAACALPVGGVTGAAGSVAPCLEHGGTMDATVLVVDDDAEIRDALRLLLEDAEYRVLEATNGLQAIEAL